MDRERFQELVIRAVNELPEEFLSQLHNLDVVVEDRPSISQRRKAGTGSGYSLLGLYEGVPQTRRGRGYGMVLPDKITIFQEPIEARCRSDGEVEAEHLKTPTIDLSNIIDEEGDFLNTIRVDQSDAMELDEEDNFSKLIKVVPSDAMDIDKDDEDDSDDQSIGLDMS